MDWVTTDLLWGTDLQLRTFYAHSDQCSGAGSRQQDTPKAEQGLRYVRVIHPHHPLVGQVVKVVRQLGQYPGYAERQWVIELPDHSRTSLPLSWAVEIDMIPHNPNRFQSRREPTAYGST
jgi:hypothetical protein